MLSLHAISTPPIQISKRMLNNAMIERSLFISFPFCGRHEWPTARAYPSANTASLSSWHPSPARSGGPTRPSFVAHSDVETHDSSSITVPSPWRTGACAQEIRYPIYRLGYVRRREGRRVSDAERSKLGCFGKRRCLVPAGVFYEWQRIPGQRQKQPYAIARTDGRPMVLAGLWETRRAPDESRQLRTFTIVTTNANEDVMSLHHRMPVIIEEADWNLWLGKNQGHRATCSGPRPAARSAVGPSVRRSTARRTTGQNSCNHSHWSVREYRNTHKVEETVRMAHAEHYQIDFAGFLRTDDNRYLKHEDFLAFIAGAAPAKAGASDADRARAWLRHQGVKGEIDGLSPAEVSRLMAAAQKAIVAKHGRGHGTLSAVPDSPSPSDLGAEEPLEE